MSVNLYNSAVSGLKANQFRIDVSANNVANINTDGFKASSVHTAAAGDINGVGQGVRVAATYTPGRPGAVTTDAAGQIVELSNTDLANETTGAIGAQHAFNANAAALRSADEITKTLLDITA